MATIEGRRRCHDKMQKAVVHLQEEFGAIRTGRATPALVEKLQVDYYGTDVPLQQLAGFSRARAARARHLALRQGRDQGDREGDPDERPRVNPRNDGSHPPDVPAAHRGRAQGPGEGGEAPGRGGRVAVRNVRRHARHELERSRRTASSPGRLDRLEKDLEKATPRGRSPRSTRWCTHKERELLEV
jgi:ribosome recycling factor